MTTPLRDQFRDPATRARVLDDALKVLEAEVGDKGGLGGMAIKATFGLVKSAGPGLLHKALDRLFDDFIDAFEGPYERAVAQGKSPGALVVAEKHEIAMKLLSVTDGKVQRAGNPVLQKAYDKLRPSAQKHVEDAAPRISGLLDRHAQAS